MVVNQKPNAPEGSVNVTTQRTGNKVLVELAATATDPDGDEVTLEWDARDKDDMHTSGTHAVSVRVRDSGGEYSAWTQITFEVSNAPPDAPVGKAIVHRDNVANRKAFYTFEATAADLEGDPVTYEGADRAADDHYVLRTHEVKVRAKDSFGAVSEWVAVPFELTNQAPEQPKIVRTPPDNFVLPGNSVTVNATSTDPDGDALEYIWEGRPAETHAYPDGRVIVRCIARNAFGAESTRKSVMWIMGDPNCSGSSISEPGIEDATLVY